LGSTITELTWLERLFIEFILWFWGLSFLASEWLDFTVFEVFRSLTLLSLLFELFLLLIVREFWLIYFFIKHIACITSFFLD
jgi:hypothetical protein